MFLIIKHIPQLPDHAAFDLIFLCHRQKPAEKKTSDVFLLILRKIPGILLDILCCELNGVKLFLIHAFLLITTFIYTKKLHKNPAKIGLPLGDSP